MKFVILGPPVTKKNSMQMARTKDGRMFPVQSAPYRKWAKEAIRALQIQYAGHSPIVEPVQMNAQVYRARPGRADMLNYLAAISDVLEVAGVLIDDKLVASVDGSRLYVDRDAPRVEVELTPVAA